MAEIKEASHPWTHVLATRRGQRVAGAVEYVLLTFCIAVAVFLGAALMGEGLRSALASAGYFLRATAGTI